MHLRHHAFIHRASAGTESDSFAQYHAFPFWHAKVTWKSCNNLITQQHLTVSQPHVLHMGNKGTSAIRTSCNQQMIMQTRRQPRSQQPASVFLAAISTSQPEQALLSIHHQQLMFKHQTVLHEVTCFHIKLSWTV